ncbi:peptide ABC transporter substrate-binding protein [Niveispirillum sp.]|uniref:peptide ABC transporter substrate-binding protein n=1 Tax=Niveispirillum sp. TaxID=1917217 RepID=UPI001B504D32|nr:peptide ABC transporter substrate-binding protein [Niveispirillum sp.]MBP7338439.1 peptide ABC transporter substrate-binding protein [Niveispirillum sp.]
MRLLVALCAGIGLAGAAHAADPLRIGIGPEPETLDPHRGVSIGAARLLLDLCEGLLTRDGAGRTIPGVAARSDRSADGLTLVFHLRPDARWWNGDPVTAADFVRGWRRAVDPATGSGIADLLDGVENAANIRRGRLPPDRLGVQAADTRTLVVRLERPLADFDTILAHRITLPVHGPTLDAKGVDFANATNLTCNGPFRLVEHRLQERYLLERADTWHGRAGVALARVEMRVAERPELELNLFRAGDLHITSAVPPPMLDWARAERPDALHVHPWTSLSALATNPDGPAWRGNPDFLLALDLALDREQLTAASQGRSVPAYGLVPATLWSRPAAPDAGPKGEARRDAARAALARAGFGPDRPPPRVEIVFAGAEAIRQRVVAIAAQWKQVLGVETELVGVESRMVSTRLAQRDFQGFLYNTWIGYSPSQMLASFLPPSFTLTATDPAAQQAELRRAEQEVLDSRRFIPLFQGSSLHMVSPAVRGWQDNLYDIHPVRLLSLAPGADH